jgi:hypothetical protein
MTTVAMHQPDLLPYSGFFHKMALADVFEIGIYYQFTKNGYQRRVKMRDQWASIPVIGSPNRDPIKDVLIHPERVRKILIDTIRGRYAGARYWKLRGDELLDMIIEVDTPHLWQFNLALILGVRDVLGITTPISIGSPLKGVKTEAVVNSLQQYGRDVHHLSGPGARVYMNENGEFDDAGITYGFTRHAPVTGDSIVSVLMDYADPLEIVLREEEGDEA